ncbi:ATP-binding protein [Fulvivirgaceae bacterium BMA12]|uniref:histidine kinase n=1 Tax=Agaribacillus aureus TaxID=3051825 RepID=A0ABT8L7V8_9BACT|nr:ATP-binding protein [Fulvivirgaceae bacterium BMA12]
MVYKNFRINVVLRIILMLGSIGILIYSLLNTSWLFTPIVAGAILLLTVLSLIIYVEQSNKDLANLLISIRQRDFTTKYASGQKGKSFERLSEAFNLIIREFQKINTEKESQYQYLQTLNESIGAGIISYKPSGEIQLFNQAARQIMGKPYLNNLSELKLINPNLYRLIAGLKSGDRVLTKYQLNDDTMSLSIDQKEFKLGNQLYTVLLLQNIQDELDENEVRAWQKLTKVLTHEIMNSVTPIASLTAAVNQMIHDPSTQTKTIHQLDDETLNDIYGSLETVEKRSKSLLKFVEAYKDFSRDPELKMRKVNIIDLIDRVLKLFKPEFDKYQLSVLRSYQEVDAYTLADPVLLEGVFINLFKNAIEALSDKNQGEIAIKIQSSDAYYVVGIQDNGPGVDQETLEKMFIPFYTSKKGGSGIGLSISKKIMRLHGGFIGVESEQGKGMSVQLKLKKYS